MESGHQDKRENQDHRDFLAQLDVMELLDPKVFQERSDHKEHQEHQERTVKMVSLDQLGFVEPQVVRDFRDQLVLTDHQDHKVPRARVDQLTSDSTSSSTHRAQLYLNVQLARRQCGPDTPSCMLRVMSELTDKILASQDHV